MPNDRQSSEVIMPRMHKSSTIQSNLFQFSRTNAKSITTITNCGPARTYIETKRSLWRQRFVAFTTALGLGLSPSETISELLRNVLRVLPRLVRPRSLDIPVARPAVAAHPRKGNEDNGNFLPFDTLCTCTKLWNHDRKDNV